MTESLRTFVVVNPHSANGRTAKRWRKLEPNLRQAIGPFDLELTVRRGHAAELARAAAREGYQRIIAVGGDGTLSETVDGLFDQGRALAPGIIVAHLCCGTGGDFRKSLGFPQDPEQTIALLARGPARPVDVGYVKYVDHQGQEAGRAFINIASFGISGLIDRRVNAANWSKMLGGSFAFYLHALGATLGYRNSLVRIQIDDHFDEEMNLYLACVCNGQYAGGGMRFAPQAQLDDGLFDVLLIGDFSKSEMLLSSRSIYAGTHLDHPKVRLVRGRRIIAHALEQETFIDVDGEAPGRLAATFDLIPQALKVVHCPLAP